MGKVSVSVLGYEGDLLTILLLLKKQQQAQRMEWNPGEDKGLHADK